ncbi:MAG TPA: PEP phosphonomutase, partial [Firmicutes bacterium]|nr:PEP phosphonomutase [Bacillota bacterium]
MVKRLLDCNTTDFKTMNKKEIINSIKASEGRVIVSEIIGAVSPLLHDISNAELAAAFGADRLLLNMLDLYIPVFYGLQKNNPDKIIKEIKELTG